MAAPRPCNKARVLSYRTKVKSGCKTCKIRKVKCDEERPICNRCRSSGRVCDGYGIWGGGGKADASLHHHPTPRGAEKPLVCISASPTKPLQAIPLTSDEESCFEWYLHRSSRKLPGAFISDYWTSILYQACTTEPAIRHAILALASAHMEEVRGGSSRASECNDEHAIFTVRQYSKAITCLQPCFSDTRRMSVRITLITCALFVYMESLRGHYKKGLAHLEHGVSLLQSTGSDVNVNVSVKCQNPSSTLIDGWIVTIFLRLLVQAKLFGQPLRCPCPSALFPSLEPYLPTFRSIHHARRSLEHIVLRTINLQEEAQQSTARTKADVLLAAWQARQLEIQNDLARWLEIHSATTLPPDTQDTSSTFDPRPITNESFAYRLLLLYHLPAYIQARTCLQPSSSALFDQQTTTFLAIITHCIQTYQLLYPNGIRSPKVLHDPEPTSSNSISDIGWIGPLYYTAMYCRNRRVRWQAVQLMEMTPHKEGIWDARLAVLVAKEVIRMEERELCRTKKGVREEEWDKFDVPSLLEVDAAEVVPVARRVSAVRVVLPENRAGILGLKCERKWRGGGVESVSREYDLPTRQWRDVA